MNNKSKPATKMTISAEELRGLVTDQHVTDVDLAKRLGVCSTTVMHWRQSLGIERARQPKKKKIQKSRIIVHGTGVRLKFVLTKDKLIELYVNQGLPQREIAAMYGVTQATVGNALKRYEVPAQSPGGRPSVILDKEILREMYWVKELSMQTIARELKCGESTVRQNLIRHELILDSKEVNRRHLERNKAIYDRVYTGKDYVQVKKPDHAMANQAGYVAQHRLVAEAAVGKPLNPNDDVHHINLRKHDNAVGNLAILPTKRTHALVHKYMERVGVFLLGLTDVRPEPLAFEQPVFWGGQWVTSVDLIARSVARSGDPVARLAQSIRENGLKYEFEDAA